MRRIRVAPIERPARDDGHVEDILVYALLIGGLVLAAFVLGAQLQAVLGGIP